jgi:hypothetical protein
VKYSSVFALLVSVGVHTRRFVVVCEESVRVVFKGCKKTMDPPHPYAVVKVPGKDFVRVKLMVPLTCRTSF